MKRLTITSILACIVALTFAQGPNNTGNYYQAANGKKGEALKTALFNIIKAHTDIGYSGLKAAYKQTDVRADGYIRDWYSSATQYEPGSNFASSYKEEGDGYNREHSMPQSWFDKASPMRADIVHVFPTDAKINGNRGDNPFGEVNTNAQYSQSTGGYSKWGSAKPGLGFSGTVFEPNDEIKGDIARIYFYMTTCYQDKILTWTGGSTSADVIGGTTYKPLKEWVMTMMLRWSEQDPVDEVERARNAAVYTVQKNRNPFVDYPGLEQYVWGTLTDQSFSYDHYANVTRIDGVYTEPEPHNGAIYNLKGQRVDGQLLRPGLYVREGRKFLVR